MNVKGTKIKSLVDYYANMKDYPSKSSLAKFCEDYDLNYNQWNAYIRETQAVGIKIIHQLMDVFPKLNLNWLLKDEGEMFVDETIMVLNEPKESIKKEISSEDIYKKLEKIHFDILSIGQKEHKLDTEKK